MMMSKHVQILLGLSLRKVLPQATVELLHIAYYLVCRNAKMLRSYSMEMKRKIVEEEEMNTRTHHTPSLLLRRRWYFEDYILMF